MTAAQLIADRADAVRAMAAKIPSPCTSLCTMDPDTGCCRGCLRTLDEIVGWAAMDDDDKQLVWARLAKRADASLHSC